MAYTYENVLMKLIILYAKYFNENLKSDVVGIIPYMVTSATNRAHPREHPVPPVLPSRKGSSHGMALGRRE